MGAQDAHIDAIAIVAASSRWDSRTVGTLLAALDFDEMAEVVMVLALMVPLAVRTQGVSVEQFLDVLAEKTAQKSMEDPE